MRESIIAISADAEKKSLHPELVEGRPRLMQLFRTASPKG
jgi:hypothetical protein